MPDEPKNICRYCGEETENNSFNCGVCEFTDTHNTIFKGGSSQFPPSA